MTVLKVPLPEPLEAFVATQVAAEGHASAGDYVLSLLSRAQQAKTRAALEAQLLVGVEELERGEGREMTAADWELLRSRIRAQYGDAEKP
jgi:hypothetical protein